METRGVSQLGASCGWPAARPDSPCGSSPASSACRRRSCPRWRTASRSPPWRPCTPSPRCWASRSTSSSTPTQRPRTRWRHRPSADAQAPPEARARPRIVEPVGHVLACGCLRPEPRRLSVSRPDQRPRLEMDSGVIWERLADSAPDVDFIEIIYPAGSSSTNDQKMMRHAGPGVRLPARGRARGDRGVRGFTIGPGDALSFDSSVPHLLRNRTSADARGIWCVLHPH